MLRLAVRRMPACTAAFPRSALALAVPVARTQVRSFNDTPKEVHPGQIWTPPTLGTTKISKKFLFTQFAGDRSVHSIGNRVVSLIATAGLIGMALLYWNSGLWAHSFITPTLLIATILWLQLHVGSWAVLTGGILVGGYAIYLFVE